MLTFILVTIYIAFISLGLPDSLLGSAWPAMYVGLGVPVTAAGVVSVIVSFGTIISSVCSVKLINRFGTGAVTVVSVAMTAGALFGYSMAPGLGWICLFAIPMGLGAGSVDAALNNFVAVHYKARHMSWLHCFWGVGATAGPIIMAAKVAGQSGWRGGYLVISGIQVFVTLLLFFSLPAWNKQEKLVLAENEGKGQGSFKVLFANKLAFPTLLSCFCYCAMEAATGLWSSTYLVKTKGFSEGEAVSAVSLFYFGITFGRLLTGFLSIKLQSKTIVRIGQGCCIFGALVLFLSASGITPLIGLLLVGLGGAPIYPSILHETPARFGSGLSQYAMGIQMAVAYIGTTFVPPLLGVVANAVGFWVTPVILMAVAVVMLLASETVNRAQKQSCTGSI